MITPNDWYDAFLDQYGMVNKEGKNPYVWLQFSVTAKDGSVHPISWRGMLHTEKAEERTLKTLITVGMKGDDVNKVGEGKTGGVLDHTSLYRVKVEQNEYQGKTSLEIGLVSRATPKGFQAALDKKKTETVAAKLKMLRSQMGEKEKKFEPGF